MRDTSAVSSMTDVFLKLVGEGSALGNCHSSFFFVFF